MLPYNPQLKTCSRHLRSNMTDAEQKLWQRLRKKQILGVLFYRQKPIADFIVDFYCAAAQLVIELDGCQHFSAMYQSKEIPAINICRHWACRYYALIIGKCCWKPMR